jgi:hypothetical protein
MRLLLLPLACIAFAAMPHLASAAEAPSPAASGPQQIERLISDLGSDEYTARERAAETLMKVGLPAFSALEKAAGHPDREVRFRAQRILGTIRHQDLQRRLESFLSGKETPGDYPLPSWTRFEKAYGDDATSRKLFVDMQRADPDLLQALEEAPRAAVEVLTQRALQHQQAQQQQLSLGQLAATLFIAAEEDVELPAQAMTMIFSYCYQQGFRDVLGDSSRRELPRQMLGAIVSRSEDFTAYQAMTIAYQLNLSEGLVPAVKILEGQANNRQPHMIQYALMTVARLGDAAHLPLVEKLMADPALLTRMKENETTYDVQVRDAALVAAVLLSKQELRDYFDLPPQLLNFDPQMIFFNARVIGFPTEEKRAEVFAKWEKHKGEAARSISPPSDEPR